MNEIAYLTAQLHVGFHLKLGRIRALGSQSSTLVTSGTCCVSRLRASLGTKLQKAYFPWTFRQIQETYLSMEITLEEDGALQSSKVRRVGYWPLLDAPEGADAEREFHHLCSLGMYSPADIYTLWSVA